MKKIISIILILAILPIVPVWAEQSDFQDQGFAYEVTDGEATIIFNSGATYDRDLVIPETLGGYPVTAIGDSAFWECYEIASVTLPASVKRIEDFAFWNVGIEDINIENLEYIGPNSLGRISMEELHFPAGCHIDNPVYSASGLKKITVGDYAVLEEGTFEDETQRDPDGDGEAMVFYPNITDIEIGNNVTLGTLCFAKLDSLERVSIGDGTSIGDSCFSKACNLENLVLGKVTSIGEGAFSQASLNKKTIKEITIPGTVQSIGAYAFSFMECVEKITLEEGVETVGEYAFCFSEVLMELYLPKSLKSIGRNSFPIYPNCFIFYAGTKAMWREIENAYTFPEDEETKILYNYYVIDPTYVPKYVNEVTIMGKGTAYGRFILKHINNTIAKNRTVEYSINGGEKSTIVTDENGYVVISIGGITQDGQYVIEFTGTGIQTTQGIIDVTVKPLAFSSSYEAMFTIGGNGGFNFGVGGSGSAGVEKMEAEASLAEIALGASMDSGFRLDQQYVDGKNQLTVSAKRGIDFVGTAEAGLFADVDLISLAGVDASLGSLNGGGTVGGSITLGYRDDDFDLENEEDVEEVAKFLASAFLEGLNNNIVALYIAHKIDPLVNIVEKGSTLSLDAGASIGVFETNVNNTITSEATIASGGGKMISENTTKTLPDKSKEYRSSTSTATGVQFASLDFKTKKDDVTRSAGLDMWNSMAKNKISFSAESGSHGTLGKISMTTEVEENNGFLFATDTTVTKHTISYEDSAARAVVADYTPLSNFAYGAKGHFSKEESDKSMRTMAYNGEVGQYSISKEKQKGLNLGLSGQIKLGVVLGGEVGLSGIESYEYEEFNGVYEKNTAFIQAHNEVEDEVADKFMTVPEALEFLYGKISAVIEEYWDEASAWVDENIIEKGKNKIKKTKDDATEWFVSVITPKEEKTYALKAKGNAVSLADYEEKTASTLGAPCIVSVADKEGNLVEDLSQNPLELTLGYDQEELDELNIWEPHIAVLYWDTDRGVYLKKDAEIDTENCTATLDITEAGQYMLAVDNGCPSITEEGYFIEDNKPYLRAKISDFSGIDRIILTVNGEEKVNKDNFLHYYNEASGWFIYPIHELMEPEESVDTQLIVYDSFDNEGWTDIGVYWYVPEYQDITVTEIEPYIKDAVETELLYKDMGGCVNDAYLCMEITDVYGSTIKREIKAKEEYIDYGEEGLDFEYRRFRATLPKAENASVVKVWYELWSPYGSTKTPVQETLVLNNIADAMVYISKIEDDKISVTSIGEKTLEATDVYIAVYDRDGCLVKADRATFAPTVTFENIPREMNVRVFLWNGAIPLCQSATIEMPSNLY